MIDSLRNDVNKLEEKIIFTNEMISHFETLEIIRKSKRQKKAETK